MRHGRRHDTDDFTWASKTKFVWDTPLSTPELSQPALEQVARMLVDHGAKIDVVVTSPFLRCLQTTLG